MLPTGSFVHCETLQLLHSNKKSTKIYLDTFRYYYNLYNQIFLLLHSTNKLPFAVVLATKCQLLLYCCLDVDGEVVAWVHTIVDVCANGILGNLCFALGCYNVVDANVI